MFKCSNVQMFWVIEQLFHFSIFNFFEPFELFLFRQNNESSVFADPRGLNSMRTRS